ncbi:MAG: right-handed parallel beta-helix repeat-containing protein [Candidatus Krumholzibacteriia bacterium]
MKTRLDSGWLVSVARPILALALLAPGAGADIIGGGPVAGIWTVAGSPYLVTGEIDVPVGETLVIEPGVEVRFEGWYKFNVHGCLLAVGAEADSIRIHAADPGTGWHGLRLLATATSGQPASRLAYCRIEDGRALGSCPDNSGAGLYLDHAKADLRHCLITGNQAITGAGSWGGGGLALDYCAEVTIAHCRIEGNATGGDGGGIYLYWSTPTIEGNVISGNNAVRGDGISALMYSAADLRGNTIAGNGGQGVYLSGSAASLVNNRIEDNQGSGVECYLCDPHLIGNLIAGNDAYHGGGVLLTGSDARLTNNTIAGNSASQGGGIYATWHSVGIIIPSEPILTNTVVYGNTAGAGAQLLVNTNCAASLRYCDVQDLASGGIQGSAILVEGNLDLPPAWTGDGDHPYALAADSPCRDAGTPDCSGLLLPATDLAGHERICGGCVDIGAYEYSAGVPVIEGPPVPASTLAPAYPNPFNPRTTLTFRLPAAGAARLDIVDVAGRRLATVWDGPAPAGVSTVSWTGTDTHGRPLPSGTYLARLRAAGTVAVRPLQLVR